MGKTGEERERGREGRHKYISLPVEADKYKQNFCMLRFIGVLLKT